MCEHNHEHCHSGQKQSFAIIRIALAIIIFTTGLVLQLTGVPKFFIFLIAYLTAGGDVLFKAFKNILKGQIFDENFLMSLATVGAFAVKEYPEAVMVMVLYQIGEYFQDIAVEKSKKSIADLMDVRPDYANLVFENATRPVNPEEVNPGDEIIVKTGEKIPLDGIVIDGNAIVDTSALTGESLPQNLKTGDNAISGCINTNGVLKIKVTKPFGESTVSKILELVEHANSKKTKAENFITKFARYYTPAVVAAAVILAVIPPLLTGGNWGIWFQRALIFLVISCPCALVISVPLSFFGGIGGASKCGILVKGSCYLEMLANAGTVIFDKTGTLTKGSFAVTKIKSFDIEENELLEYAALAETYSNHPIAVSLKNAVKKYLDTARVKDVEEISGNGVKACVDGKIVLCGNEKLLNKFSIPFEKTDEAGTIVYLAIDSKFAGYIVISDEIKEGAKEAVTKLKKYVKNTVILSGDNEKSVQETAFKIGVGKYYSELLPADKVEITEKLINQKQKNKSVIFVGDGINDAPVLTRADAGIAMGALGSDAAIEAADVVIMDDNPVKVYTAIALAKKTLIIVKQNIIFALAVKALFLIFGALGFVTMWGAVFADVGVSLIAILNALRTLQTKNFS